MDQSSRRGFAVAMAVTLSGLAACAPGGMPDGDSALDATRAKDTAPTRVEQDAASDRDADPDRDAGQAEGGKTDAGPLDHAVDAAACPPEEELCGDLCVDLLTDKANCGACDRACPTAEFCLEGECEPMPIDCRETPCPTTHYCNLEDGVCLEGCGFDVQCPQPGSCDLATHSCLCDPGTRLCGDVCEAEGPVSCGPGCLTCPVPDNAEATCVEGACGSRCLADFHVCSWECVANSSTDTCGDRCAPCPAGPNSSPTCDGAECGLACAALHGDCDADPATGCETPLDTLTDCGGCDRPCAPDNATASCALGRCAISACDPGFLDCNDSVEDGCEAPATRCWRDLDGDGYGDRDHEEPFCGDCPEGWVEPSYDADCDDNDDDVFPDNYDWYSDDPTSAGDYDYDCSGVEEKEHPTGGGCYNECHGSSLYGTCWDRWPSSVPACGESQILLRCCSAGDGSCFEWDRRDRTQGCH